MRLVPWLTRIIGSRPYIKRRWVLSIATLRARLLPALILIRFLKALMTEGLTVQVIVT